MRYAMIIFCMTLQATAAAADCTCGPDFCQADPRYASLLEAKKQGLRADGYPERLISLLDRDGACVARVTQAPDGFSILTVDGNTRETWPWNEDNDRIGRERLVSGELNALHVFNTARSFACCQEPRAEDRSDWDAQLGINRNIAITCKLEAGAVACR